MRAHFSCFQDLFKNQFLKTRMQKKAKLEQTPKACRSGQTAAGFDMIEAAVIFKSAFAVLGVVSVG